MNKAFILFAFPPVQEASAGYVMGTASVTQELKLDFSVLLQPAEVRFGKRAETLLRNNFSLSVKNTSFFPKASFCSAIG